MRSAPKIELWQRLASLRSQVGSLGALTVINAVFRSPEVNRMYPDASGRRECLKVLFSGHHRFRVG
jgi:hypothetical protein